MKETTNKEILNAILKFAGKTEKRFGGLENRMGGFEDKMYRLEEIVGEIKTDMLTKDYIDEKMFDWRGDIMSVIKKEDNKLRELANILKKKGAISKIDFEHVFSMDPFSQIFV